MSPSTEPQPTKQGNQLKKTKGHWGQRKRRLRRVAWILSTGLVVAAIAGFIIYRSTRRETRRPGEKLDDITENLARGLPEDAPRPLFTDITEIAGLGGFVSFTGTRTSQLPEDMGAGMAWGDYDNDGDDDLFLVGAGGSLNLSKDQWSESMLFENRGDGTFSRDARFPETRLMGMGAAWGDYDDDGWLDLAVSGYESLLLFRNDNGQLRLSEAVGMNTGYWSGISWADFDNDRDLDLYVCGYVQYKEDSSSSRDASEQYGTSVPYTLNPASFDPERNLLFQNNGDGSFTEVAQLFGVSNPEGRSLGALWHDFNDDGWLDLYVANDISDNALLLNRQETFEDVSLAAWVADYRGAMGLASADWNRDGDDDLFVTHWIAQENALYDSRLVDFRQARQGEDNSAPDQLSFSDLAAPLGLGQIALHTVGWGTEFVDFDGDGWLDLLVANGNTLETDQEPKSLKPQADMLLWSNRGKSFHDLAPMTESFSTPHVSRGLAISDFDLDGDMDIAIHDLYEGVRLLRNDMPGGNWVQFRLRNQSSTKEVLRRGEGSTMVVTSGELRLRRSTTSASYLSQSSRTLYLALGESTAVDSIEVRWLGGETQQFGPVEVNTTWELIEGESAPKRIGGPTGLKTSSTAQTVGLSDRERVTEFWRTQRAAMDAIKIEGDIPKATALLETALALNPDHEDSRYYLANCLATQGEIERAKEHLETLTEINPLSHRAYKQLGVMRAMTATNSEQLASAERALERSLEINQEETGALLVLGELDLIQGDLALADERLALACRTNPKAVGGFFLRGYMAWKSGDRDASVGHLKSAVAARGEDWVPEGAVAEGDVAERMHRETSPLSVYWEQWDGDLDPDSVFADLDHYLTTASPVV
jgi:tetratricopeptide (TPR) repeat protein